MPDWTEQSGIPAVDNFSGIPDWLKRLVGGAKGPAPTPAATPPVTLGGGAAPQPPPVKSSEMSTTPVKAPPVSYASQAAQMAGQEPQRDQFQAKPIGVGRNLLGIAGSILQGLQNPANAGAAEKQFLARPKQQADDEYNQAHQQWVGKMAQIVNQANLAKGDAEIGEKQAQAQNLQSETRARDNKPDPTVKPGTPQEQAFEAYIKQGMDPTKAYRQVIQDAQDAKPDKPDTAVMDDRRYRDIQARQSLKQPISADDAAWAKAYEKQKTLSAVTGGELRIKGLGETREYPVYDSTTKTTRMVNADEINRAMREEPNRYTAPQYTTEAQTQKKTGEAFAPGGKAGEELLAFNTAIAHGDLLKQAATALKNGDVKAMNSIKNRVATELGVPDASNFQVIANAYTREVTKALSAGHITDKEIEQQGLTLPANASPAQIMGALDKYSKLMESKVKLRKDQYKAGKEGTIPGMEQGSGGGTQPQWNPKTGRYE